MSNNSNEILTKTLGIWCADFSACIKEKTESLSKILEMFGLRMEEFSPVPETNGSELEYQSPQPTIEEVYRAAKELEKEKCSSAVRNLMRKYGVEDLKYLDVALYSGFINDAEELANEPC